MKESSAELATIAAKVLKSRSHSPESKQLAASVLSQRETDNTADLISHVREFIKEADKGGLSVSKWAEIFRGDLGIDKT